MKNRHSTRNPVPVLLAVAALALLAGCTPDAINAPDDVTAPDTPAGVLDALREAYESMSIEAYADLLHPDFRFIFADPRKAPYAREDDLASTGRMFSGVDQKNSAGGDAPAVAGIVFDKLEILEGWERVSGDEVDWSDEPHVMRALIDYGFTLNLKSGGRLRAAGHQVVYACAVEAGIRFSTRYWRWQLLGQRDP
ncbi:hypothetical protein H8E07_11090 [bacterium]|nr:hypothetical protein [bacterium]